MNRNKSIFARCFVLAFEWISNESSVGDAYITLDSQDRLYMSAGAVKKLNLTLPAPMLIGYDKVNKRLIIAKPELVRAVNTKPFKFNKDQYAHAKAVVRPIGAENAKRPLHYYYVGKDYTDSGYPDGAHVFELKDFDAPDGGIYEE
jgi:hypothetical protein